MKYDDYLLTDAWKARRDMKLAEAGHRCQVCNSDARPLHVHHRTYDRCGREHPADLTVLCSRCHAYAHGLLAERAPDSAAAYGADVERAVSLALERLIERRARRDGGSHD